MKKIFLVGIVVVIAVLSIHFFQFSKKEVVDSHTSVEHTSPTLSIHTSTGTTTLSLLLARTETEQEKGLGDRTGLEDTTGMLFIFPYPDFHLIWMKDMHFPIDIIWLDHNFEIVGLQNNVAPETYPQTFGAPVKDLYVLEVNAHYVEKNNLKVGDIFLPKNIY